MIEITAMRLERSPVVEWYTGKWKSSVTHILSTFHLDDCPPFHGWLFGGEARMTSKSPGGMSGDFITTGTVIKLRA